MLKKTKPLLLFILLACLLLPAAGWADGGPVSGGGVWPQFQNDLYNDGVTLDPAPVYQPAAGWVQPAGGAALGSINATPVVAGGDVFVLDDAGKAWAFDAKTGARNWVTQLNASGQKLQLAMPAYDSGRLYLATNDGQVYALDAASGKILWDHALPLASSSSQLNTPVKCAGRKIYLGAPIPARTSTTIAWTP